MDPAEPVLHRSRAPWWLAAVVAAISVLVLRLVLDPALARLHPAGGRTFNSTAFTGPFWPPFDTARLTEAVGSWTSGSDATLAGRWVLAHLGVDLILFAPAYTLFFWYALQWLVTPASLRWRPGRTAIRRLPLALLVVETVEGIVTLTLLKPWSWQAPVELGGPLWIVAGVSAVKFALLALILLTIAVCLVAWTIAETRRRRAR